MDLAVPLMLDEAIQQEKLSAAQAKDVGALTNQKYHEQLVNWLEELQRFRKSRRDKLIQGFLKIGEDCD